MYEDPDFPADERALGPARDADAVRNEHVVWLRPHEIISGTSYRGVTLFGDDTTEAPGYVLWLLSDLGSGG